MIRKKLEINLTNRPGIVIRIALVLERQGYSLEAMKIAKHPGSTRMYLEIYGDQERYDRVVKNLSKLVDVIEVGEIRNTQVWEEIILKGIVLV